MERTFTRKNVIEIIGVLKELDKLRNEYMDELTREIREREPSLADLFNHRRGEIRKMMDNRANMLNSIGFVVKFETYVIEGYETIQRITIAE